MRVIIMNIREYCCQKRQIITFMLIGAGTTVFDLAVFNGILLLAGIGVLSFVIANTAAFVVTNVVKYLMNSHYTFAKSSKISLLNGLKFILVSSCTFLVFNAFMYLAFTVFPTSTLLIVNEMKLFLGFVSGGVNFVLFKSLVFS
ncbi:MAG TPA: GtrA family protein [Spirochaetia bacterium]|nr:GtrA family protein [Spirochaetia bacterium]